LMVVATHMITFELQYCHYSCAVSLRYWQLLVHIHVAPSLQVDDMTVL
jgi:hypothetical protein